MDKTQLPASFGVFKPVGCTLVAFCSTSGQLAAAPRLLAQGLDEAALARYTPQVQAPHHPPAGPRDRFALGATRPLRAAADLLFAKRYGHRAIVLETVAAVPRMVGAMLTHLSCPRRMVDDRGWIRTLLEEAENERLHLMTFIALARPTAFERAVVLAVQALFWAGYLLLYAVSRRTAHRLVGCFEEEAVLSYTLFLQEIDAGRVPNGPAPAIAIHYWQLQPAASLRDVVCAIRDDEAHQRDINHALASHLAGEPADLRPVAAYPRHADSLRGESR